MADTTGRSPTHSSASARPNRGRRLIAGLRVTAHDEALLAVVRPYLVDVGSEGDVAYRLWRRGLEITLAEVAGLGAQLPPGLSVDFIASLVAQRLLLCVPLLRRTGKLELLGIEASPLAAAGMAAPAAPAAEPIDVGAADAIAGLGGNNFL